MKIGKAIAKVKSKREKKKAVRQKPQKLTRKVREVSN